jgi:hypothetical protein
LLHGLYVAAVVSIILLMNVLVFFVAGFQDSYAMAAQQVSYDWRVFVGISLVVITLVGLGSMYRVTRYRKVVRPSPRCLMACY